MEFQILICSSKVAWLIFGGSIGLQAVLKSVTGSAMIDSFNHNILTNLCQGGNPKGEGIFWKDTLCNQMEQQKRGAEKGK